MNNNYVIRFLIDICYFALCIAFIIYIFSQIHKLEKILKPKTDVDIEKEEWRERKARYKRILKYVEDSSHSILNAKHDSKIEEIFNNLKQFISKEEKELGIKIMTLSDDYSSYNFFDFCIEIENNVKNLIKKEGRRSRAIISYQKDYYLELMSEEEFILNFKVKMVRVLVFGIVTFFAIWHYINFLY